MKTKDRWVALTASITFTLCLGSAEAAVFDAGQALKADMTQGTPTNPYMDAHGGRWTFGKTTAVTAGTVTPLDKQNTVWAPALKGFSDGDDLPTLHVNTGTAASGGGGLTSGGYFIAPGEIALHPDDGNTPYPYAIIRFTVPQAGFYHVLATFRDVSISYNPGESWMGVDVHVVVNGTDVSNAVVCADAAFPAGSVQSFTVDLRSQYLAADATVDFVVGPTGTGNPGTYYNDGTALRASITAQTPYQAELINLDFNGYKPREDPVPGTNKTYSGNAPVGAAGDFWNRAAIPNVTFTNIAIPNLKLTDGITSTTVRFSVSVVDGGLVHGDCIPDGPSYNLNPLLDDYLFIDDNVTNRFTLSGLVPDTAYDLYFFSHAGKIVTPGRFIVNGIAYDSVNAWFTTDGSGDYAVFAGIPADSGGSITGFFCRATGGDATFDGLQIVGTFPRSQAETVNLDINGYGPGNDPPPGAGDTYSGAARIGAAGDFWNGAAVGDQNLTSITAPSLKLTDGITNTTVSFSMSRVGGGSINGDRAGSLNALLNDYVYVYDQTNRFTIAGLVPNAAYDLYFYSHVGVNYDPGRFVIKDVAYDSIDEAFPAGGGGDVAVCAGIAADDSGSITGYFCKATESAGIFNGLQIVGTFPRQHADLVNLDINGYGPGGDAPAGAGNAYSGAARVGADGDYWNRVAIANDTVASITVPHLKRTDGLYNSTVTFSMIKVGGGTLGADRIDAGGSLNPLLDDYVYFYGETISFTISGLVPDTPYDLYFYCHAGIYCNPARFTINGVNYYSFDKWFPGGAYGDYAVCSGIIADGSGSITGTFCKADPNPAAAGVLNGLQIMGTIPRLPLGTIIRMQ